MRRSLQENLLREYVQTTLLEFDAAAADVGYDTGGAYGISFGSSQDLIDTFITPFTDVFKTAVGQTKEITRRAGTVLWVYLQATLTTLIPIYGYDYAEVFEKEKADVEKIREEYSEVYKRTDAALASNDAALLAFMAHPGGFLTAKLAGDVTPEAAKETRSLLSAITGGFSEDVIGGLKGIERWSLGDEHRSGGSKSPSSSFGEARVRTSKKKTRPKLADLLSNRKFLNRVLSSPQAVEMQRDAQKIYKKTLNDVLDQAEDVMKKTNSIEDIERHVGSKLKGDTKKQAEEIKKLPPAEKTKAEEMLVSGVKKAMKDFYVQNLADHYKSVVAAGIPESSPYVNDYKSTIQKIQMM